MELSRAGFGGQPQAREQDGNGHEETDAYARMGYSDADYDVADRVAEVAKARAPLPRKSRSRGCTSRA